MLQGNEAVLALLRPLLGLLERPGVTELVVNRPGEAYIESDTGWERIEIPEMGAMHLRSMAAAIASFCKQTISNTKPILSGTLPGKERVQIVLEPAVETGQISFTIRRPDHRTKDLSEYSEAHLFDEAIWRCGAGDFESLTIPERQLTTKLQERDFEGFFRQAVTERLNICIVGDTGSGKTTLMKSLCAEIPRHERLITIEDVRELFMLNHGNQSNLLYVKDDQGLAKVSPSSLIASCMRMKPDRVLLAELRGSESYDFLKLLTTGHAGSITSFHAESCARSIARFALMAKEHPEAAAYAVADLKKLLFMTIDVIAHLSAKPIYDEHGNQTGKRRVMTELYFDPSKKRDLAYET